MAGIGSDASAYYRCRRRRCVVRSCQPVSDDPWHVAKTLLSTVTRAELLIPLLPPRRLFFGCSTPWRLMWRQSVR